MTWRDLLGVLLLFVVGSSLAGCGAPRSGTTAAPDDTVNVGYGEQARGNVTGATATVEPRQQDQAAAANMSDLLEGRTAGVQVKRAENGIKVTVRGPTTVNAGSAPLYVVDGMPVEPGVGGTVPVNPRDVASITVLKDAAASSIYGSRGANGVIVIETKDQ